MKKDLVRLNKYLSNSGIASRRAIDKMIRAGQISVNGKIIDELGTKIDPAKDIIVVNGKKIQKNANTAYIILNKPLNVVSTTSDSYARKTVVDLIDTPLRLYPVGRLDSDSIGLILLTNDGELTHKLTHPKFHISKTYEVKVKGLVTDDKLNRLRNGIRLSDGLTSPAEIELMHKQGDQAKIQFTIHEGRNRQIRRMCGAVDLEVLELKRISIGPIKLDNLKSGEYKSLTDEEISSLKKAVGLM